MAIFRKIARVFLVFYRFPAWERWHYWSNAAISMVGLLRLLKLSHPLWDIQFVRASECRQSGITTILRRPAGPRRAASKKKPHGRAAEGVAGAVDDAGELESGLAVEVATPPRSPCNHQLFPYHLSERLYSQSV
jgi:hypothetical protein